jgi:hypothetical protein
MGTPTVMSPAKVADKWARRTASAGQDYEEGAIASASRWVAAAAASEGLYKQGVSDAMAKGSYSKGIQAAGAASFAEGVKDVGASRYAQGAAGATQDFASGIAPVLEVISRTDLPPRGPRGSEGNYQRATVIGRALAKWADSQ